MRGTTRPIHGATAPALRRWPWGMLASMSVDVRPEILVRRPRADVAAYMFDPANDLAWTGGITASTPNQPGSLLEGSSVVRTARFLGRTFDYGYVVTAHEPERLVEMKVDKPFPISCATSWLMIQRAPGWPSPRTGRRVGSSAGPAR